MEGKRLKNTTVTLKIESVCGNGNGFSHLDDGTAVFVTGAAEGDVVRALIIKQTKSYCVAKTIELIEASKIRVADKCNVGGRCGGCVFGHISYEFESEYKKKRIEECLERIGGLSKKVDVFHPAKQQEHYRNKAIYPVGASKDGRMIFGFYARNSHRITEHDECIIGKPEFTALARLVVDFCEKQGITPYDEATQKGVLRGIYIRGATSGDMYLVLIINSEMLLSVQTERALCDLIEKSDFSVCGISLNVNKESTNAVLSDEWRVIKGDGFLHEVLCKRSFRISPAAFFQVNHAQTQVLYGEAARLADIKQGETLLDLYCGTGTIGICLARENCRLVGVEVSKEATIDASYNAKQNGIEDSHFICLDADEALDSDRVKQVKPDVVIIDPPRKGCGIEAVRKIASLGASRIVYVSCDPATLARDLAEFSTLGFAVREVVGVDMFPRTGHVECVVLLSKVQK